MTSERHLTEPCRSGRRCVTVQLEHCVNVQLYRHQHPSLLLRIKPPLCHFCTAFHCCMTSSLDNLLGHCSTCFWCCWRCWCWFDIVPSVCKNLLVEGSRRQTLSHRRCHFVGRPLCLRNVPRHQRSQDNIVLTAILYFFPLHPLPCHQLINLLLLYVKRYGRVYRRLRG